MTNAAINIFTKPQESNVANAAVGKKRKEIPVHYQEKCHGIIHGCSLKSAVWGAIPIPFADAIPICGTQVGMVIALGKVFGFPVGKSVAKSIALTGVAMQVGRFLAANASKVVPIKGSIVGATTAFALTEALGWMVADDFYRLYMGEKPEELGKACADLAALYKKVKGGKK